MLWYRVFNDGDYLDFDTYAEAESYYHSCLMQRWQDYKDNDILDWEEDKQWFDLSIVKMETILTPAD